ncbi:MAG: aminotransferase class I/II-fold pyridoxal phosphate-dependent enzyme, partial [bacterium]|nr:aminotransferase class I/II-fold pyridoxal phosphate-dependent enzyme [bacterium]
MQRPLAPLGRSQGVPPAALVAPEELARRAGLPRIVRLGSNESPFGPAPQALEALAAALAESGRYADPQALELRTAIARRHGVALDEVTVGAGVDDLLGWIVRAYVAEGAPAVASLGGFPTFEMHVNGFGGILRRVPYRADARVDLDGLLEAARAASGGMVYLANPDNPTGSHYPWREIAAFLDALPDGSLLVHDEAYANFAPACDRHPDGAPDPRVIRLRTFSKEYGLAGLRVGYALAARQAIAALDSIRLLYGVGRPAQAAALASLQADGFVADVVARIATGRAEYERLGQELGIRTFPSTANFVLFDFGTRERAERVVQEL